MSTPGFTAENSLSKGSGHYYAAAAFAQAPVAILQEISLPVSQGMRVPGISLPVSRFPGGTSCDPVCHLDETGTCVRDCTSCPPNRLPDGCQDFTKPCPSSACCPPGQEGCYVKGGQFCCPPGVPCCHPETHLCCPEQCCFDHCCGATENCCTLPGAPVGCCPADQACTFEGCCNPAQVCGNGCCLVGQLCCAGVCKDKNTDPMNCGGCGNVCTGGKTCVGGTCVCPAGLSDCAGVCTTLGTNLNCRACGDACTGGKACAGGTCACPAGLSDCAGVCTTLGTNQNCRACGDACIGGKTCVGGTCVCPAGLSDCFGVCTILGTNLNCRACGDACTGGRSCVGRQCVCPPGLFDCDGKACCIRGQQMCQGGKCGPQPRDCHLLHQGDSCAPPPGCKVCLPCGLSCFKNTRGEDMLCCVDNMGIVAHCCDPDVEKCDDGYCVPR
jgi:hypothetical protein